MRGLSWVILFLSGQVLLGQDRTSPPLLGGLMERVSVATTAWTYGTRGDYGVAGTAALDVRVATLDPFSTGFLFTGDAGVFGGAGLGARYKIGDLRQPLNFKSYFVGVSVPLLDLSRILRLDHPFGLHVSPFYENALTRNYKTGNHNGVRGFGASLSITWFATDYLGISAHLRRVAGRQPSGKFIWDTVSETAGLGITLSLGRLLESERRVKAVAVELNTRNRMVSQSAAIITAERDSLLGQFDAFRDSLLGAASRLARMADERLDRTPVAGPRPPVVQAKDAGNYHEAYDAERMAPVRIIKIDKRLFLGHDLVEEEYLKAILSIVSKHSAYVWEIAYRDSPEAGEAEAKLMAENIRQFFQIYDSRLRRKLVLTFDGRLRTEFEIRCLGLAKQDLSEASREVE